ncbi:acylphosphatase [Mycetocola zhadangensis]|uniref:acylphosphatase n=1 Tax=Mycetocola zhadangensis TaxID=1164595 RepID=UPI003A4DFEDC
MIRKHVIVHGNVQGVGFRYWTRAEATRCGVTGWVRNRLDGTVEAELEGSESDVSSMIEWLRHGPEYASVSGLDAQDITPRGDDDFVVL